MSNTGKKINLGAVKTFFDPNPGLKFCGAAASMPAVVKKAADELDGKTMSLSEAVAKIQAATKGAGEIKVLDDCIMLFSQSTADAASLKVPLHCWRVIRYR